MKKVIVFNIFMLIFMIAFFSVSYAVTDEDVNNFIENYPYDYIYRVDISSDTSYYFSSPSELTFEVHDTPRGYFLYVINPSQSLYLALYPNGDIATYDGTSQIIGYSLSGNYIDVYIRTSNGFFLPLALNIQRDLAGLIRTILPIGFGALSGTLLVRQLTGFFRRFLHRSN